MTHLKINVDSLDTVPEAVRSFYKESDDGGFTLQIADPLIHQNKYDSLKKKFDARQDWVAPTALNELQSKYDALSKSVGNVDELVTNRVKDLQQEWNTKEQDYTGKIKTYEDRFNSVVLKEAIIKASGAHGVRPSASDDILNRAQSVFKVVDGNVKAFDSKGEERFHKGTEAYTPDVWLKELKSTADHLFEANTGGGATGNVMSRPTTSNTAKTAHDHFAEGLKNG